MLNKLKKHKKLIENFSALSVLQVSQLLLSFLTFPYLIKTLGMENYGVIVYSQSVIMFLTLIINYGFSATATKDIAENKSNIIKVTKIVRSVFWCKFILLIPVLVLYISSVYYVDILSRYMLIYYIAGFSLFSNFLISEWFFQGIEEMINITYAILFSRVISVVLIFCLIKGPQDLLDVAIINAGTSLVAAIISLFLLSKYIHLTSLLSFHFYEIRENFEKGFAYFLSNIVAASKEIIGVLIIGAYLNYQSVAMYDFCKKILNILLIPSSVLVKAVFPQASVKKSFEFNCNIEKILLLYAFLSIICIIFIPDFIWMFLFNGNIDTFKSSLYLIIFCLPFYVLCGSRGFLTLVGFGENKKFANNIYISSIIYIFILMYGVFLGGITIILVIFALISSLMVESLLHIRSAYSVKK